MKYVKYGHGKWQPVWKISFNMTGSKETLQEVAKKVAERYGTGPSFYSLIKEKIKDHVQN